ncbi:tRNA dimethylallyltransferase 2 isoform X3 [Camellia sinensis]|uniref:tRNA dimethylallyltransferase 2 isoform X3 n=1 Tax=Camellia sinensis TaxID=4442 RepID=UPI0010356D55|nr:tRNA dimethylallyltransferase 2 isoform X3 [Camellia sinensis]
MQEGVLVNPSSNGRGKHPKVVVIMGATGSGKSRLAIDLALHFPLEIINADSMQVYQGLDVLTNKVPLQDQKGVPHHLLGTISPNVEFTAKDFRDSVIPLIDDILSRNRLPVIVGGTNYYIQALVSPFLLDDSVEDKDENGLSDLHGDKSDSEFEPGRENFCYSYDSLKDLDPVAANRIHPNDHRKINQYLSLYARFGVLPSKLLQEKAMEKRRLNRLNTLFGWNIHYVDATESLQCASDDSWAAHVVEPSAKIIRSYLSKDESLVPDSESRTGTEGLKLFQRDLWTQHVCKVSNKLLVAIECLEGRMNGNNTNKVVAIENGYVGLGSLEVFPLWSSCSFNLALRTSVM